MGRGVNLTDQLRTLLTRLKLQSPCGFAAAFQVAFATPRYLFQTYDEEWMNYYSKMGLVMKDPAVRWGFANDGIASWPELQKLDDNGVFDKASEFGLNYWAVMATSERNSKSIGAFSRSDKDFSDGERKEIFADFKSLHHLTLQGPAAEPEFGEMLLDLSIRHTHAKI
ncbi:autoinducer binding domain-containing protein [Primorskyibacter marinus]|uniref:autoinducer binding domain-containing protein n=1 Tax=Primorskyibacter marinus TaxID=1977320 RepID=UPI000E302DD2|nr:autoinducer binding domain-containing protein [Primorskyibacter marinus]